MDISNNPEDVLPSKNNEKVFKEIARVSVVSGRKEKGRSVKRRLSEGEHVVFLSLFPSPLTSPLLYSLRKT